MQIDIERLDAEGEPFTHTYGADTLSLDDEARLASEATVVGRASRKDSVVKVSGNIRAEVEVFCDRCAASVTVPLEVKFDTAFLPAENEKSALENVELQKDDPDFSIYEGETLDLDDVAREQILLALPMRRLCREECKGLCPTCGLNLNTGACSCAEKEIDPRWAGLADLRKDQA
jgi:uncharacterized protein